MVCLNAKFAKSPNGYLNTHVRFSEKTERSKSYPNPIWKRPSFPMGIWKVFPNALFIKRFGFDDVFWSLGYMKC